VFIKGVKTSLVFPQNNGVELSNMFSVGFDGRISIKRVLIGVGAGLKIPMFLSNNDNYDYDYGYVESYKHKVEYGGYYMDLSTNFYFIKNQSISLFGGIGITPCLNFLSDLEICLAPNVQAGVLIYKLKRTVLTGGFRFGKNVVNVDNYYSKPVLPLELGVEFGLLW
jgi:hypothetical protein